MLSVVDVISVANQFLYIELSAIQIKPGLTIRIRFNFAVRAVAVHPGVVAIRIANLGVLYRLTVLIFDLEIE